MVDVHTEGKLVGRTESVQVTGESESVVAQEKISVTEPVGKRPAGSNAEGCKVDGDERGEPQRKRQASSSVTPELTNQIETEREEEQPNLPDPNDKVSPDEFLLQLVKAQYGVELEVKRALSLESFFSEVTEEQMAAYNTEVVCAVRNNNLEELKTLHEKGQALDCFNRFGESLLNLACRRGFEEIVRFLLDQPEVDMRICDDGGRTPLHDACWHPSPQLTICKWIIERDPALFLISDKRGFTAFQYARPQHWDIWRKFLFENRACLKPLSTPELRERLQKS